MENELTKYERAKKRVAQIRGFYNHLAAYIIVNAILLLLRNKITFILISKTALGNPDFLNWIDWNIYGTPIIWGVILMFHAIKVFGKISFLGSKWEERQLERFMKEENENK